MTYSAEAGMINNYHLKTDKTMKKYIFMAAALMMMGMGMSSCSNNDEITEVEQAPKKVQLTLTASFDMGGESRAVWDGLKPKFVTGDKVGVYSDNHDTAEPLDVTVDGDGNATLTGSVTAATEYHLVFPYKEGTTYNKSASPKTITGFDNFAIQKYINDPYAAPTYPSTALHYVKVTSLSTTASFKPLCAILKCSCPDEDPEDKQAYIRLALITSPVINITNDGAEVVATQKNCEGQNDYTLSNGGNTTYFPVAPGSVTLASEKSGGKTKTGNVVAGKIYNIPISER